MLAAIGDIHGELGKLERLLDELKLRLAPEDTILFIGDYIDRGPDSKGVIDLALELAKERPVITLRGNHEQMLLDALEFFKPTSESKNLDHEQALMWFYNGADQTMKSYPGEHSGRWYDRISPEHWAFYRSTLMEIEIGNFHFVHAGLTPPGHKWKEWPYDPRLWIREEFITSRADFGKIVVFGHTPMRSGKPLVQKNKIGIDTAAAYGGPLTAVLLDTDEPYTPAELKIVQTL